MSIAEIILIIAIIIGIVVITLFICQMITTCYDKKTNLSLETAKLSLSTDAKKADIDAMQIHEYNIQIPERYKGTFEMEREKRNHCKELCEAYREGFKTGYTLCKQDVIRSL